MTAEKAFNDNKNEAMLNLKKIEELIEKYNTEFQDTNKKDWGFAGSLGHVNRELTDIINHLK